MGQAAAHPLRVALEPARTRVRRGHEGEPGGEIHGAGGPGNDDTPVLERLPQAFQGVAPKLAQLIEEEDSVVSEWSGMSPPRLRGQTESPSDPDATLGAGRPSLPAASSCPLGASGDRPEVSLAAVPSPGRRSSPLGRPAGDRTTKAAQQGGGRSTRTGSRGP